MIPRFSCSLNVASRRYRQATMADVMADVDIRGAHWHEKAPETKAAEDSTNAKKTACG